MLTQDFVQNIKSGGAPGSPIGAPAPTQDLTDDTAYNAWKSSVGAATNAPTSATPVAVGNDAMGIGNYAGNAIKTQAVGGVNQMKEGYNDAANATDVLGKTEAGMKMLAGGIGAATAPLAPALKPIGDIATWLGEKLGNTSQMQDFVTNHPDAAAALTRIATDTGNTATVLGTAMGAPDMIKGIPDTINSLKSATGDITGTIKNAINTAKTPPPLAPLDEVKINDLYNRAIRPTVAGKNSAGQIDAAANNVSSGLQAIAQNKEGLKFTDANGEEVVGQAPKSVDQLSQAVSQTKASIFKQYDAMAASAGEKGITIDPAASTADLDQIINNKAVQLANPKAVEYAQEVKQKLSTVGEMTPEELQNTIAIYNNKLKGYYQNPTPAGFSEASVDALMTSKLREALDAAISSKEGPQYQALKKQYGALSSMEKDVAHRNIVWARQNNVGLAGNLANITSGAELARGLITMNPADIAASLSIKGIQKYVKYLNDPDVGVSKIFSQIEKSGPPATKSTTESGAVDKSVEPLPDTLPPTSPKVEGGGPESAKIQPRKITKDTSLTGEDARIQDETVAKYEADPTAMRDEYLAKNKNVINTDKAREMFKGEGYNGINAEAVHEASSAVANDALDKLIEDNKGSGKDAYYLAGGSGAGKSTATGGMEAALDDAAFVLDGNLSTYAKALTKLEATEKAGIKPTIMYVYKEPTLAWNQGIIDRLLGEGESAGRVVTLKTFLENTSGSLDAVKKLSSDGFPVLSWDNSFGKGESQMLSIREMKRLNIPTGLPEKLTADTEKAAAEGRLTKTQYNALMKDMPHTPFEKLQ